MKLKQAQCEDRNRFLRMFKCCGGDRHWIPEGRVGHCCGPRPYIQGWHICCGNEIQSKTRKFGNNELSLRRCCAKKQPYVAGKEMCCDSQVRNSTLFGCCRNVVYDRKFETCCMGQVTFIGFMPSQGATIGCCGAEAYDTSKKICCNFKLFDFVNGSPEHTKCCKQFPYDQRTHICCNSIKKKVQDKDSCCYGKLMNSKTHICCNFRQHELIYGKENTACCRSDNFKKGKPDLFHVYNKATELCCGGKVVARVGQTSSCCIQQAYDVSTQVCCNHEVHEKTLDGCNVYRCCGKKLICADQKICCAGEYRNKYRAMIYRRRRNTARCCGWRMYDSRLYQCGANNHLSKFG